MKERRVANVLVIDAEEIILSSVAKALGDNKDIEYDVTTASSAVEGLKLVREKIFDVILVDISLPGVNGREVLRRIRNTDPSARIIVMSGYSPDKTFLNEVSTSADSFLPKPFSIGEIRSEVSRILHHSA